MKVEDFYKERHGENTKIEFGAKAMMIFAKAFAKQENEQLKELLGRANTLLHRIDDKYQDMPDEYDTYVEDCVKL